MSSAQNHSNQNNSAQNKPPVSPGAASSSNEVNSDYANEQTEHEAAPPNPPASRPPIPKPTMDSVDVSAVPSAPPNVSENMSSTENRSPEAHSAESAVESPTSPVLDQSPAIAEATPPTALKPKAPNAKATDTKSSDTKLSSPKSSGTKATEAKATPPKATEPDAEDSQPSRTEIGTQLLEAPLPPSPPAAAASESSEDSGDDSSSPTQLPPRQQPIPPASEPMQYRAIGLIRGKYVASEEQFTRGSIFTEDGVEIRAVLLGRVMSLVKKHLNLEESHLWVVYPRTRDKGIDLHVQIVGVWEPEKLNRLMDDPSLEEDSEEADQLEAAIEAEESAEEESTEEETAEEDSAQSEQPAAADAPEEPSSETPDTSTDTAADAEPLSSESSAVQPIPASELDDCYFSVRGEIIFQSLEDERLLVKIRRSPKGDKQSKDFKVALKGNLEGKAVGYFWDLHVQRQENELVVQEGTLIGMVPPQKRQGSKSPHSGPGGPRRGGRPPGGSPRPTGGKRWNSQPSRGDGQFQSRPYRGSDRPSSTPGTAPSRDRGESRRPIIKRRPSSDGQSE